MGLYNVIQPCFVNGLHYVNPTTQPIQVDDDEAGPLVEAGSLEPYGKTLAHVDYVESVKVSYASPVAELGVEAVAEALDPPPESKPRRGRKSDPEDAA